MAKAFSEHLRALRFVHRLSQKAVAIDAGLDGSYLSSLERGRRGAPRAQMVERLASAIGLNAEEKAQLHHVAAVERARLRYLAAAAELAKLAGAEVRDGGLPDPFVTKNRKGSPNP